MMFHRFCIPLLIVLFINCRLNEGATPLLFIQQPVSQNISEGDQAIFNCTAYYSLGFYWLVNHYPLAHPNNADREMTKSDQPALADSLATVHLLFVPGKIHNNNITVQCFIYSLDATSGSVEGKLNVQGILDQVVNLQAVWLNSSSLQVSFHPPTTLDGVPITNYTISLSPSSGIGDNVSLTTESLLTVVNDLSWCFSYNVTVSAWNNVGEGNETFLRNRGLLTPKDPFSITVTNHSSINQQPDIHVHTFLNITMSASYPFVPESINVSLNGQNITEILSTYCVITALTCNDANFKLRKTEKSNDLVDITANLTDYVRRASKSHQPEYDNDINITISLANCAGVSNFSAIGLIFPDVQNRNPLSSTMGEIYSSTTHYTALSQVSHTSEFKVLETSSSCHDSITMPSQQEFTTTNGTTAKADFANTIWLVGLTIIGIISSISILSILIILVCKKNRKRFRLGILLQYEDTIITMPAGQQVQNDLHELKTFEGCPPERIQEMPSSRTYEAISDMAEQVSNTADAVKLTSCPAYASVSQSNNK